MIDSLLSRLGIEVWKNIPDFEGLYQVSNLGNVRIVNYRKTGKYKIKKKCLNSSGRYNLGLSKNKIYYAGKKISVLVAMAFLNHKPCGYKLVVDHKDNNPTNDRLYNLQLITHRENCSKDKKGTSKHTGVYWHKLSKKWKSQIRVNGKRKALGLFTNELEAANAYKKALEEYKNNIKETL